MEQFTLFDENEKNVAAEVRRNAKSFRWTIINTFGRLFRLQRIRFRVRNGWVFSAFVIWADWTRFCNDNKRNSGLDSSRRVGQSRSHFDRFAEFLGMWILLHSVFGAKRAQGLCRWERASAKRNRFSRISLGLDPDFFYDSTPFVLLLFVRRWHCRFDDESALLFANSLRSDCSGRFNCSQRSFAFLTQPTQSFNLFI